jgi:hypothetical protein
MHGVFKAIVNGVSERGYGGFVFLRGDECAYLFPNELEGHDEVKSNLAQLVACPNGTVPDAFFVAEVKGETVHVVAYPRQRVAEEMEVAHGREDMDCEDARMEGGGGEGRCVD